MRFAELRALLVEHGRDPLSVTDKDHDAPEVIVRAPSDAWKIWHHDGVFDVGGVERGRFLSTASFDTEDAACDYLADLLLTPRIEPETPQQRARSEAVSEQNYADARRRLAQLRADDEA